MTLTEQRPMHEPHAYLSSSRILEVKSRGKVFPPPTATSPRLLEKNAELLRVLHLYVLNLNANTHRRAKLRKRNLN